jgi:hypothetical protein
MFFIFFTQLNQILIFCACYKWGSPVPNFKEIRPREAALVYAERRTDGQADGHDEFSSGLLNVFRLDLNSVT